MLPRPVLVTAGLASPFFTFANRWSAAQRARAASVRSVRYAWATVCDLMHFAVRLKSLLSGIVDHDLFGFVATFFLIYEGGGKEGVGRGVGEGRVASSAMNVDERGHEVRGVWASESTRPGDKWLERESESV